MARFENPEEMKEAFGELTARQLWALTKFAKHIRLRCRNNTAFNNYMNRMFPYAKFTQVKKTNADGTSYPGLKITVAGQDVEGAEDED
jgi:hypothetical protein